MKKPFLLSSAGSTRATAYSFGNKIIRIGNKTHVVWLDSIASVKGRTYDHTAGSWSDTFDICEGYDNHTNPAITADNRGYISMAWGPHGSSNWNNGRFKWMRTENVNDISTWCEEESFGYAATYACMTHTNSGMDAIAYRGGESPASVMFQHRRSLGGWTAAQAVFGQDIEPQYTNMGACITSGRDGVLYLGCHFYNVGKGDNHPNGGGPGVMGSFGAGLLKSRDLGVTWTTLADEPVVVPTLYPKATYIPTSGIDARLCGMVLDSGNQLWALTCSAMMDTRDLLLSCWRQDGWETVNLSNALPAEYNPLSATLTIDTSDRLHIALSASDLPTGSDVSVVWGDPGMEVFLVSIDAEGGNSACEMVSVPNDKAGSWFPSINMPGLYHPVEQPVVIYTHGAAGKGCMAEDRTEVYCVLPEDS